MNEKGIKEPVFMIRVGQTRKDLEGSATQNSTEMAESRGLAFAPGRASGLGPAGGLVWKWGW